MSSIDQIESMLRAACEKADAAGVALVTGAFEVESHTGARELGYHSKVIGCCAWGAASLFPVPIDGATLLDDEYDAIEEGWDSWMQPGKMRTSKPLAWWKLGRKLAAEFSPVPASSVGDV